LYSYINFTIFLQTIIVIDFYWFLYEPTTNITFSLTNNYSPHKWFVKVYGSSIF